MTSQLLFTDVDRTLLTHEYRMHPRVVHTVSRALQANIQIVLATPRSLVEVKPCALQLGLTNLGICLSGSWIGNVETGVAVEGVVLDHADAVDFMNLAYGNGANPLRYTANHIIACEANLRRLQRQIGPANG
jgi:HAD superfamily hydrolase (TIGR01484 family)